MFYVLPAPKNLKAMRDWSLVERLTPPILSGEQEKLLAEYFGEGVTGRILTAEVFDLLGVDRRLITETQAIGYAMAAMGWMTATVTVWQRNCRVYLRGDTLQERSRWITLVDNSQGRPELIVGHPFENAPRQP